MEILALSGFARSGKDEAAKVLVEEFGFTQIAFADKLREVLYQLNPIVDYGSPGQGQSAVPTYIQDVIDEYGWGGYKETSHVTEIRRLLQRLGTEAGRQTLWDSIWIDAALTGLDKNAKVCVTDCRFVNEAEAIRNLGGRIIRIERQGVGPANDHLSEHDLDGYAFDGYLMNDGTLSEYREKVVRFANELNL